MEMTVTGYGYPGTVHAVCMVSPGYEVVGIDVDQAKVRALSAGKAPFHEPGLEEMIAAEATSGRLRFTAEPTVQDLSGAGIHFITVGAPQSDEGGSADLSHLMGIVSTLTELLDPAERTVAAGESTVPVGIVHIVEGKLAGTAAALAWNPESLREGYAVEDTLRPTRLVYGLSVNVDSAFRGRSALDKAYRSTIGASCPIIVDSFSTAELVKVATNSFLVTKISFINVMVEICDVTDADVTMPARALGHDKHIGRRALSADVDFGSGYLPKDIHAFVARAEELNRGESVALLKGVGAINTRGRAHAVVIAEAVLGRPMTSRNVAVLGASFKPDTDDVHDSLAPDVTSCLYERGANVRVTGPIALTNTAAHEPHLTVVEDMHAALTDADLVILATEWSQFANMDPAAIGSLAHSRTIVDGRNTPDREVWGVTGWTHVGVGR